MNDNKLNIIMKEKMIIIYKFLIKQGCNHHDAEDISQNTLIKAMKYINGIPVSKYNSWLFTVALNEFYDICRKNSRFPEANIDDEFMNNVSKEFLCENYILKIEHRSEVSKVINLLTPVHRNLLILKYEMNLSYKEISEMLNIKEDTLKTYLYRARESFKKKWEENEYE